MKRTQGPVLDDIVVKKQKLESFTINLDDIPTDCLHQILSYLVVDLSSPQILDLFTVSKLFYKVCQDPSILSELFECLFSSNIGKQIPFKKQKNWKNYFQLFDYFSRLQSVEYESKNRIVLKVDDFYRKPVTIREFLFNNIILFTKDIFLMKNTKVEEFQSTLNLKNAIKFDIEWIQKQIPYSIDKVVSFSFDKCNMFSIPSSIGMCGSLIKISMIASNIVHLSPEIGNCKHLTIVDFSMNRIKEIPKAVGNWKNLREVDFSENELKRIPKEVGEWEKVTIVDFRGNKITKLPKSINKWKEIVKCHFARNQLSDLPNIENWECLQLFSLEGNRLTELPDYFANFPVLSQFDCSQNPLTKLPERISKQLKYLFCSCTEIQDIPVSIGYWVFLSEIDFSKNWRLKEIPEAIGNCEQLMELDMTDCQITKISEKLAKCNKLAHLWLEGNPIKKSEIPFSLELIVTLNIHLDSSQKYD